MPNLRLKNEEDKPITISISELERRANRVKRHTWDVKDSKNSVLSTHCPIQYTQQLFNYGLAATNCVHEMKRRLVEGGLAFYDDAGNFHFNDEDKSKTSRDSSGTYHLIDPGTARDAVFTICGERLEKTPSNEAHELLVDSYVDCKSCKKVIEACQRIRLG